MEEREKNDQDVIANRLAVTPASAAEPAGALEREFEQPMFEPITPELALIDPELARRARAHLPDLVERASADSGRAEEPDRQGPAPPDYSSLFELAAPNTSAALEGKETWPSYPTRPRRGRIMIAAVATFLLAGLAAGAVVLANGGVPDRIPLLRDARTPSAATPVVQRAQTSSVGSQSARPAATASKAAAAAPRAFAWVPSPKATHYRVRFFAGHRKIFEAWPVKARLTLPGEWTYHGHRYHLSPGRYRWEVEPGYGRRGRGRYGRATVRARLVVP